MSFRKMFVEKIKEDNNEATTELRNKRAANLHAKEFLDKYIADLKVDLEDEKEVATNFDLYETHKVFRVTLNSNNILFIPKLWSDNLQDELKFEFRVMGTNKTEELKIEGDKFKSFHFDEFLGEELMDLYLEYTFGKTLGNQ
ncbi:hypothetical protein GLW04_09170 [Halobacillus litoralis]|uniref:Uncharacterized protein n=1 Tax=Halobacillus litoralis TaxID=45668 RepID=A0A845DU65_9BACI|nr:hypothetical protein [Halobacillus litoralis]MYL20055.1 hypothetical protein [Halobacillus litoralis]